MGPGAAHRLHTRSAATAITYMYTRNKRDELVKFALHTGTLRTVTDVLNMADVEVENLYRARYHKRLDIALYYVHQTVEKRNTETMNDFLYDLSKDTVGCSDVEDILNHLGIDLEEFRGKRDQTSSIIH